MNLRPLIFFPIFVLVILGNSVRASPAFTYTQNGAVYTYGPATATAANTGLTYGVSNGAVILDEALKLPVGAGREAAITARATPSAAKVAKALSGFAGKVITPLVVGNALWDLAKELGFGVDNTSGTVVVTKPDPTVCTTAPCYTYKSSFNGVTSPAFSTYLPSQQWIVDNFNSTHQCGIGQQCKYVLTSISETQASMSMPGYGTNTFGTSKTSATPSAPVNNPSSLQELEDAIASKSGWPSGSKIAAALREAVASGESLPLPAPSSITGPSTVQGPVTTTTTPAQNGEPASTTTTSTVNNISYSSNTVTNNVTNNTTTTTYNADNSVRSVNTSTKTSEPEPEPVASDTPLAAIPTLYVQKYPNGLSGIWTARKAQLMATPVATLSTSLMPSLPGGGTCPAWIIDLNLGITTWAYGSNDVAPPCWVWDFGKVVILVSALLLARALIFGG